MGPSSWGEGAVGSKYGMVVGRREALAIEYVEPLFLDDANGIARTIAHSSISIFDLSHDSSPDLDNKVR